MTSTLQDIRSVQPEWFSRKNKRFFNDVSYKVLHGKVSKRPYLVRSTYAWTDMFGATPRLHYRVNEIKEDLKIGNLLDKQFRDLEEVKDWLANN